MEILDDNFKMMFDMLKENNKQIDFFDIISPKETLVSKWLEFVLNPSMNGIGNLPLAKLIELTNNEFDLDEYEFIDSQIEVSTDQLKRMDIVVKFDGLWIVIENKIDSLENGEQTNDYYKYIENNKGQNKVIYIYLKPNYNVSLPKNKNFVVVTYDKLLTKFKEITEFDFIERDKYKYFKEFIISGGRFMRSEEIEITDSLKFYLKNQKKFENIINEYTSKNKQLVAKISQNIIDYLNSEEENKYDYSRGTNTYLQIYKSNWDNSNHQGVHFEIIFNDKSILGKQFKANLVLHIENNIKEDKWVKLNDLGFKKISSLGCSYNGVEVKENVELDFTNPEKINDSIKLLCESLKEYENKYEKLIDKAML